MKKEKIENLCQSIAIFICNPSGFEIGGTAWNLKNILNDLLKGEKSIRKNVFSWLEYYIRNGDYDKEAFSTNVDETLKMAKEDYDKIFFK